MIEIYLKSNQKGKLTKENVGAWIFSMLSSEYHDNGLNEYFNGSKVKAHSYLIENESFDKGALVKIEIRGIEPLEKSILSRLDNGISIRIGKLFFDMYHFEKVEMKKKQMYDLKTPLIMRNYNKVYKHEKNIKKSLNTILEDSLKRKYELIYGEELLGLKSITLFNKKESLLNIKIKGNNIEHMGYEGKVEIVGTDEAIEFILSIGLGNRTTYGYGVLG